MEKVKLTQEQADAIWYALQKHEKYSKDKDLLIVDAQLYKDPTYDGIFGGKLFPLNYLQIWAIAKAVYIGYVVVENKEESN